MIKKFKHRGVGVFFLSVVFAFLFSFRLFAALSSNFEAITFTPAVDSSDYFTLYSSQNLKAWQGNLGFYFDYANRPLQFVGTGGAVGRQSVIDHLLIADFYGGLGFTDWFEAGINIPVVLYNWFFTDNAAALPDHGGGMGDIQFMTKFRVINTETSHVGFALMPFITLPSGDTVRYTGNGNVTGGLMTITDFIFHPRFAMTLNLGGLIRDDTTKHGVRIDDQLIYGLGANIKLSENWHAILEGFGRTNFRSLFQNTGETPIEAGAGIRYIFGDSGFALDAGANAGIIDGVGAPRVRGYLGLKWTSPLSEECPACPPPTPPPDPRIRGDKIMIWGKIFFDTDKATIKPISLPVLDDVVDVMQKNPQLKLVEVQGHCDARGSDAYNMKLSDRRSHSVRDYLIGKGIEASRLASKGYGESRPIADNTTKEGMSQNRRTEFVILQKDY